MRSAQAVIKARSERLGIDRTRDLAAALGFIEDRGLVAQFEQFVADIDGVEVDNRDTGLRGHRVWLYPPAQS